MKKLLVFLAVFILVSTVLAQNPVDTDSLEKNIGYKVVNDKVWFMKEKTVESVVCVPGKPGCFLATTTLKPVDVYTLKGSIPEDILIKMSWADNSMILEESGFGKFMGSYADKYLVHYSEYNKTFYKKDVKSKSIYASDNDKKRVVYYDLRLMIFVGSLFSICAVSFLSGKRFDKKHPILIIILVILWVAVIAMNVALFLSWVCNASPQYAIDGLHIEFVILISFFTAIINGIYVQDDKKIPTAMVFSQMVCLIFYVASIPTTDTSLSIIIPIFSSLVLIKFFKSLSTMFKPIMA